MTPVVVLRSASSICEVCGGQRMVAHFPGPYVDLGIVQTDCLHCGKAAIPIVVLPWRDDRKDLRRTS